MTKINAIPVALLEHALRLCREGTDYFKFTKSFMDVLDFWRSSQADGVIESAILSGDLPADWYASNADWPDPVPLDAFSAPDPRAETMNDKTREDLAALNDGLQALGALSAMILRISERLEGVNT